MHSTCSPVLLCGHLTTQSKPESLQQRNEELWSPQPDSRRRITELPPAMRPHQFAEFQLPTNIGSQVGD
jgi:hypothetical protein